MPVLIAPAHRAPRRAAGCRSRPKFRRVGGGGACACCPCGFSSPSKPAVATHCRDVRRSFSSATPGCRTANRSVVRTCMAAQQRPGCRARSRISSRPRSRGGRACTNAVCRSCRPARRLGPPDRACAGARTPGPLAAGEGVDSRNLLSIRARAFAGDVLTRATASRATAISPCCDGRRHRSVHAVDSVGADARRGVCRCGRQVASRIVRIDWADGAGRLQG